MNKYGITYCSATKLDFEGNIGHVVKINIGGVDKLYHVVSENRTDEIENTRPLGIGYCSDWYVVWTYELSEIRMAKTKSNGQLEAEKSVIKAKEALLAAENVLKLFNK